MATLLRVPSLCSLNRENFFEFLTSGHCKHPPFKRYSTSNHRLKKYVISCSGGLDSMVLLHLMQSLKYSLLSRGIRISAIYVNHNLSQFSHDWGLFCQSVCRTYQIPLQILSVNAKPKQRQSPEAAARDARYSVLKDNVNASDCLLTAHHQSDQAETLLLQLLRGSGPRGLAAMPAYREFAHSALVRPLLNFSRQKIKDYALKHQLKWVDDESNSEQKFKRNFLRHSILPKLQQQWSSLETTLFRASQLQSEAVDILEEVAEQDLLICELDAELELRANPWFLEPMLDRQKLQRLSPARVKNCIQFWLRKTQAAVLNSNLLKQLLDEFIDKQPGAKAQISWKHQKQQFHLRHYQNRLFLSRDHLSKTKPIKYNTPFLWNFKKDSQINVGQIQLQVNFSEFQPDNDQLNEKINQLALSTLPDTVQIMFRQGGEYYKKNQFSQHFSLKNWFQEHSIPPWLRTQIPLIYVGEQLIQIGNCIVNYDYRRHKNKPAIRILCSF